MMMVVMMINDGDNRCVFQRNSLRHDGDDDDDE